MKRRLGLGLLVLLICIGILIVLNMLTNRQDDFSELFSKDELDWIKSHGDTPIPIFIEEDVDTYKQLIIGMEKFLGVSFQFRTDPIGSELFLGALDTKDNSIYHNTKPINTHEYKLLTQTIYPTIDSINNLTIGYIEGDIAQDAFKQYPSLTIDMIAFLDEEAIISAINEGDIDGFITEADSFDQDILKLESLLISGDDIVIYGVDRTLVTIIDKIINYMRMDYRYTDLFDFFSVANSNQVFIDLLDDDEVTWLDAHKEIGVGVVEEVPMVFKKNNNLYGPAINYLNQFSIYTGADFSFVTGEYEKLLDQSEAYNIDIMTPVQNSTSNTYSKANSFLTSPYVVVGQYFNPMLQSVLDMSHHTIGILYDSEINQTILSEIPEATYLYYEDYSQLTEAISSEKVDYGIMPETVMIYYVYVKDNAMLSSKFKLEQNCTYNFMTDDPVLLSILNKYEKFYYSDSYILSSFAAVPKELESNYNWPLIITIALIIMFIMIGISYYKYHKNKVETAQLTYTFMHDQLTHIPNSYGLEHKFNQIQGDSVLEGAIIIVDIDHFKLVNDQFGNQKGDEILLGFVKMLMSIISQDVIIGRTGGDEFTIIANHLSKDEIDKLIIDIQRLVNKYSLSNNDMYQMTVSIGLVYMPEHGTKYNELTMYAEHAVRKQKESGFNGVTIFTRNLYEDYIHSQAIAQEIKNAIEHEDFVLYCQPQVSADGMTVKGGEILIRWVHKTMGILMPDAFLQIAEQHGLMHLIDYYVLERTCYNIKRWQGIYSDLKISVNMASSTFTDPKMLVRLKELIEMIGFDPSWLVIEITEKMGLNDLTKAQHIFHQLKQLGVKLALDDFGKGYSSISYLQNLEFDVLKIDKSFIDRIHIDQKAYQVYEIMTQLADVLKLSVVAEGVELIEQVNILKEKSDIIMQGYYYSKPLSITEFEAFYNSKKKGENL